MKTPKIVVLVVALALFLTGCQQPRGSDSPADAVRNVLVASQQTDDHTTLEKYVRPDQSEKALKVSKQLLASIEGGASIEALRIAQIPGSQLGSEYQVAVSQGEKQLGTFSVINENERYFVSTP